MFCREVKYRLNNSIELDSRLLDHVRTCPKCQAEMQMANLLKSAWLAVQEESESREPNFEDIKARVMADSANDTSKEMTLMAKLKNEIERHPKFSLGAATAVTLFIFILVVPITINRTVGYDVAFHNVQTAGMISESQLRDLARAFGYDHTAIDISQTDAGYDYAISNLPDKQAAKEMAFAFAEMTGFDGDPILRPVIMPVAGTIYAQAKEKIKIEIKSEKKSDAEIQEEISQKLKDMGYAPGAIKVKTEADGRRSITLEMNDSTKQTILDYDIWMEFDDSGNVQIGKTKDLKAAIKIDAKGKTKEEIQKEVIQQLKDKGVKNPEVEVLQKGNGEIELRIKTDDGE